MPAWVPGEVNAGAPYLMDAVAAAYIGFSVLGIGKPNALGTLLGALLMGILLNGFGDDGLPLLFARHRQGYGPNLCSRTNLL